MWLPVLVGILTSYLLGNLNGAVCMSALMHDDVRAHGSGNAGLTNFVRNYGAGKALGVVLIDAGKAVLACLTAGLLLQPYGCSAVGAAIGGLAVMAGHTFPALLGFRGGKGILSGFFVALMLDWRVALLILALFAVIYVLTGYVSLGSVIAAATFGIGLAVAYWGNWIIMLCSIAMGALAVFMHRGNIVRLMNGTERKTNLFKKGKSE